MMETISMTCPICDKFFNDIYDHYYKKHRDAKYGPED